MNEKKSVDELLKEELWYLNFCEERLAHLKQNEEELKYKSYLNDDEAGIKMYLPLEFDDINEKIFLCQERINNLKKYGQTFPELEN
jgi:hypothetical protein